MASLVRALPTNTSYNDNSNSCLSTPLPIVALPCGSKSTNRTRRFVAAKEAAKLTVVVVFPTPPFWFAIAIILLIFSFDNSSTNYCCVDYRGFIVRSEEHTSELQSRPQIVCRLLLDKKKTVSVFE